MRRNREPLLIFGPTALLLVLLMPWCQGTGFGEDEPALSEREASAFKWLDSLGIPDVSKAPFVRVLGGRRFGGWMFRRPYCPHGFVLRDEVSRFRVLGIDLVDDWIDKPDLAVGRTKHRIETLDFEAWARANLKHPPAKGSGGDPDQFDMGPWGWSLHHRAIFVAWACWKRGLSAVAHEYVKRAEEAYRNQDPKKQVTYLQSLKRGMARERLQRAEDAFDDPRLGWRGLFEIHATWLKRFGDLDRGAIAARTARLRDQGVEADRRERQPQEAWEKLTRKERVAELIYRLCELNPAQLWPPEPGKQSAMEQLEAIGYDALPQLIEALEDRRLARQRNWVIAGSLSLLSRPRLIEARVVALDTIERITGHNPPSKNASPFHEVEEIPVGRALAETAWARVEGQGVRAHLLATLGAGGRDAVKAAQRLVVRHPRDAYGSIVTARAKAEDPQVRRDLTAELLPLRTPSVDALLLKTIREAHDIEDRVHAAWVLLARGNPSATPAVVKLWETPQDPKAELAVALFLARCGEVRALDALGQGLASRPTIVRRKLPRLLRWDWTGGHSSRALSVHFRGIPISEQLRARRERLLVAALDSSAERGPLPPYWGDRPGPGGDFVSDAAAHALHGALPAKYPYEVRMTDQERLRLQRAMVNTWRGESGLPPLPKIEGGK